MRSFSITCSPHPAAPRVRASRLRAHRASTTSIHIFIFTPTDPSDNGHLHKVSPSVDPGLMPFATQNDIIIRPLTSSDVPGIRALHSMILPVQYPPAFFTQLLLLPSRTCLIAVRASQPKSPVAFISAVLQNSSVFSLPPLGVSKALDSPRPRIEILTLGVLPAYQHFGLARRLIRAVVDKLNGSLSAGIVLYAHVATTNSTALKFYESIGMRISSEIIPNLYRTCPYGQRDAYLVSGRWVDF